MQWEMSGFDYVKEAREIAAALPDEDNGLREGLHGAIIGGATGTEIVMALRSKFTEFLKAESDLNPGLEARIKNFMLRTEPLVL